MRCSLAPKIRVHDSLQLSKGAGDHLGVCLAPRPQHRDDVGSDEPERPGDQGDVERDEETAADGFHGGKVAASVALHKQSTRIWLDVRDGVSDRALGQPFQPTGLAQFFDVAKPPSKSRPLVTLLGPFFGVP